MQCLARARAAGLASAFLSILSFLSLVCGALVPGPALAAVHGIGDMVAWADFVVALQRGPVDIAQPGLGLVSYGSEADVLGPAQGDFLTVLSLGDGGFVTLEFVDPIVDGPGDDFAVFENGFIDGGSGELFGELAFVEVSSNGVDFARLATATTNTVPVPGGGTLVPEQYVGFAGVDPAGDGTGFDLAELADHPLVVQELLDLQDVAYVRLVDVIGDGSTFDDALNPVYDPYATLFASGGFDLDGVGALHVPEPAVGAMWAAGLPLLGWLGRRRHRPAGRVVAARRPAAAARR